MKDKSQKSAPAAEKTPMEIQALAEGIIASLNTYNRIANSLRAFYITLGALAIMASVFVTTFLQNECYKHVLPYISATATSLLTIITAFNIVGKSNNARNAWRMLREAADKYHAGLIDIEGLILAKSNAENTLGGVDFQFTLKKD